MNGRDVDDLPLAQPLTSREQDILDCIGDELTNRQMAERLTVSAGTVKWYVRQVYNKLGVSSREEATARARSLGLLPSDAPQQVIRNNLPIAATSFVSREMELATLAALIADPQVHIITITGPGGIGKTRLALEAARREVRAQSLFPDGIFFVSLAPLETAVEILPTLAAVLDFQFQDRGTRNETQQLLDYLKHKQMLLVMDNFEHILAGQTLLADISSQAAGITLLVTSRERLQMRGEQLFPLQGLVLAQSAKFAAKSPAARLFLQTARRTAPDFQLLEGDAQHLLHICRLVEGMPLGLELAASWVSSLPLSAIAAEIEQSLNLLVTEHGDVPQRHQSMAATLDVSWRRLTPEQQHAFQELAVFCGGFTRAAALEVAGASLPLLVSLANKSWLSYNRQKDRYFIHELLRQYGAGKLSADPAHEQKARERHSAFFCGYLQERETDWVGPRQLDTATEVRDEIDNIQRAWRWAANRGSSALLAQGLQSLCRFYLWDGRLTDGRDTCRLAANGLSMQPANQVADGGRRLALWSQVLAWETEFVEEIAHKEDLLSQSQHLLDMATADGRDTRADQAFIFIVKAYAAQNRNYDEALQLAGLGLELYRELDNRGGEAEALWILGVLSLFHGEHDRASNLLRNSLDLSQQLEDTMGTARVLRYLSHVTRNRGDFAEAEALQRESLRLHRLLGNKYEEWSALGVLSIHLIWAGNFADAKESALQVWELTRELGQFPNPWSFNFYAKAAIHLGHYAEAKALSIESLDLARQKGHVPEVGWAAMHLSMIALSQDDLVAAEQYLLESTSVLADMGHMHISLPQAVLSYVLRAQGDSRLARDHLTRALRSGVEHRSILALMKCLPIAALLAVDDGNRRKAIELYGLTQQFGYITNSRWFEDIACRELDDIRASLPADVAAATETQGRQLDVWQTAVALLDELTNH